MKRLCNGHEKLPVSAAQLSSGVAPLSSTAFGRWRSLRMPRAAALGLIVTTLAAMSVLPGAQAQVNDQALSDPGQGRYGKAISLLKQKLEERERTLGEENPFTLTTMNSLALLYKAQGNYSEAELLYKRALDASDRTLGKENPFALATVNSLASLYEAQGRHSEAAPLYRRAQAATERRSGS